MEAVAIPWPQTLPLDPDPKLEGEFCKIVGGVTSPLLANVYLHELDRSMEERKAGLDLGSRRRHGAEYHRLSTLMTKRRIKIARLVAEGAPVEAVDAIRREIKELEAERRKHPATEPFDPGYRRLLYCRYADDFLIGVTGSKADARTAMEEVKAFLKERLNLTVSESKSGIHKATDGANFLGYGIRTYSSDHRTTKIVRGRKVVARSVAESVQLHVPKHKLERFAEEHRLGNLNIVRGIHRPELAHSADVEILMGYNSLLRGFAEYYKLGTLWRQEVGPLAHIWWFSAMKTLANKHKTSVKKVVNGLLIRGGGELGIPFRAKNGEERMVKLLRLRHIASAPVVYGNVDVEPSTAFRPYRNDVLDRLRAKVCEACGDADSPVEVHHVRKLADVGDVTLFAFLKSARTRKRMVMCRPCHVAHHSGRLKARLDMLARQRVSREASVGAG